MSETEVDPFLSMKTQSREFLDELDGRTPCPKCRKSRKFYCYTCCVLIGQVEQKLTKVKLPIKVDIIKHPSEVDGKSTAPHAAVISPEDVTLYMFPCIPDYDKEKVILVFPGKDSVTLHDLVDVKSSFNGVDSGCDTLVGGYDTTPGSSCGTKCRRCDTESSSPDIVDSSCDTPVGCYDTIPGSSCGTKCRRCDTESSSPDIVDSGCDTPVGCYDTIPGSSCGTKCSRCRTESNRCHTDSSRCHTESSSPDIVDSSCDAKDKSCENLPHGSSPGDHAEQSVKGKLSENLSNQADCGPESERSRKHCQECCSCGTSQTHHWKAAPSFDKVVFIDSTWLQSKQIFRDERLKDLRHVELKTRQTRFWRPQGDHPDTYLSTIEAIYYFITDFHHIIISEKYHGEYDNLLFFFLYAYDKVQQSYSKKACKR